MLIFLYFLKQDLYSEKIKEFASFAPPFSKD